MTANSQRLSLHGSVGELAAASCARGGSCSGGLKAGSFLVVPPHKIRRPKGRRYKTVAQPLCGESALPVLGYGRNNVMGAAAYGCSWSRLDQVVADGETNQVAEAAEIHFAHDVVAMAFHRACGDADHRGSFLVAFSAGEQLHYFQLAGR